MKENKLTIQVNIPVADLFNFTVKPSNTSLWVESIMTEITNEWPPKKGTEYKNTADGKNWNKYTVSDFEENQIFELTSEDKSYRVRYTYKKLGKNKSELEYCELVEKGELEKPFTQDVLDRLKNKLEQAK